MSWNFENVYFHHWLGFVLFLSFDHNSSAFKSNFVRSIRLYIYYDFKFNYGANLKNKKCIYNVLL